MLGVFYNHIVLLSYILLGILAIWPSGHLAIWPSGYQTICNEYRYYLKWGIPEQNYKNVAQQD